jgi:tRNA threonylcarbamoyladenosine dehydratase
MENWQERTTLLIGEEALQRLEKAHLLLVGLGGVGGIAGEMLCRAGVGKFTIIDADSIHASNKNRQILALDNSIGEQKTQLLSQRLRSINPKVEITEIDEFIRDERIPAILELTNYDYVVDAIDSLSPKIYLIYYALKNNLKIVSSMGSGGKLDPTQIQIADIEKSYNCHLARILRKHLHRLGVRGGFPVVFSPEQHSKKAVKLESSQNQKSIVGSISYMPNAFGCAIASVVLRDLIQKEEES